MKKCLYAVLLVLMICISFACQRQREQVTEKPKADIAAEKDAIGKLTAGWFAAELRRDMDASLSYLAPDAVFQSEGAPVISGTAAIRAAYEDIFKIPFTDWAIEPRTVVVAESGDLAYDIGSFGMVFDGPEGRKTEPEKSTIIWRKLDGQWKVVVCCFTSDSPPASASIPKQ